MELKIIELYNQSDEDFSSDVLETTLFVDGQEVMKGDYYHDKIDDRIEGFKRALTFLNIEFTEDVEKQNSDCDW
jgi:hypothetical protein